MFNSQARHASVWRAFLFICLASATLRLLSATELGVSGATFTIDGRTNFLLGISYYAGLGASDEFVRNDFDDIQRDGFNWIRVWATWAGFTNNISAVETNGAPREPYFGKLRDLIRECDRRGMIVDVTLSREKAGLQGLENHERAVKTLVEGLRDFRNWYLDLGNERSVKDARYVSFDDLKKLRSLARQLDARRLVTASHSSDDESFARDLEKYVRDVKVDFVCNHRPREAGSPMQTAGATRLYKERMKDFSIVVPIHYDEPFRRGYTKGWNPSTDDFLNDLRGAIEGGAAGWCFHNGAERNATGQPRRSFDLRQKRLYEQLDATELEVAHQVRQLAPR